MSPTPDPRFPFSDPAVRSAHVEGVIARLREVRDWLPQVWAGIAEDTWTSVELRAACHPLDEISRDLAGLAQRRSVREGQPEL